MQNKYYVPVRMANQTPEKTVKECSLCTGVRSAGSACVKPPEKLLEVTNPNLLAPGHEVFLILPLCSGCLTSMRQEMDVKHTIRVNAEGLSLKLVKLLYACRYYCPVNPDAWRNHRYK